MPAPIVSFADGENASGMASMLGGLLEDNLRDYPGRARVASLARGDLVLTASDRDISVTLSFRGDEVVVANGKRSGATVLAGPWLDMTKLCSGQVNPLTAIARRDLRIDPQGRIDTMAAAGFVLSIPSSFYADDDELARRRRRRRIVAAAAVAAGAAVAVAYVKRRARRAG